MKEELARRIHELTGAESVREEDRFRELGVDSITFVQLLVETEDRYGITFEEEELELDEAMTIGDLIRLTEEKCGEEH